MPARHRATAALPHDASLDAPPARSAGVPPISGRTSAPNGAQPRHASASTQAAASGNSARAPPGGAGGRTRARSQPTGRRASGPCTRCPCGRRSSPRIEKEVAGHGRRIHDGARRHRDELGRASKMDTDIHTDLGLCQVHPSSKGGGHEPAEHHHATHVPIPPIVLNIAARGPGASDLPGRQSQLGRPSPRIRLRGKPPHPSGNSDGVPRAGWIRATSPKDRGHVAAARARPSTPSG
jgi:hypothetical protein